MELEAYHLGMALLGTVTTVGVAWGSTRQTIRTLSKSVDMFDDDLDDHKKLDTKQHTDIIDRLARIETTLAQINSKL